MILLSQVLRSIPKCQNLTCKSRYSCFAISPEQLEANEKQCEKKEEEEAAADTWQVQGWKRGDSQSDVARPLFQPPFTLRPALMRCRAAMALKKKEGVPK